jgi:hypothetical protein
MDSRVFWRSSWSFQVRFPRFTRIVVYLHLEERRILSAPGRSLLGLVLGQQASPESDVRRIELRFYRRRRGFGRLCGMLCRLLGGLLGRRLCLLWAEGGCVGFITPPNVDRLLDRICFHRRFHGFLFL